MENGDGIAMDSQAKKAWRRMVVDGINGWFVPDGATTPPQSFCSGCQFIVAQQRNHAKLCRLVNKRFGGISGVTKGTDGTFPNDDIGPLSLTL